MMAKEEQIARLEARIIELEGLYMHQQKLVQDLNDVVVQLQRRLDQFEMHTARLSARTESLLASVETPRRLEDEKPPHY